MPLVDRVLVSQELQDAIVTCGIRQGDLAKKAGVSQGLISSWLQNRYGVALGDPRVLALGDALGVPPERCFGGKTLRYFVANHHCQPGEKKYLHPNTEKKGNGICAPECPSDCRWRADDRCGKYRGMILMNSRFTRQLSYETCREKDIPITTMPSTGTMGD